MKLKRFLALIMAATMLVSTPAMAADIRFVTPSLEIASETKEADYWKGLEEAPVVENTEAPVRTNELKNVEITEDASIFETGVVAPEDAEPAENRASVDSVEGEVSVVGEFSVEEIDRAEVSLDLTKENNDTDLFLNEATVTEDDIVPVIIVMDGESIIEKDSDASMNWINKIQTAVMESKQNSVAAKIGKKALGGEELDIRYHYTWLLNGIATEVPYGAIDEIEAVDGVKDVLLQTVYQTADVDPYTVADGEMIGRDSTWADGYTGKGIKISIIDTGIDEDHQNFAALPEDKLTADSATESSIAAVLGNLNASALWEGLTVDDVYYSTKIAYGFNYVDENITINHENDSQGDHGTHVAGISAANDLGNNEAVGVAPDAQLYVMKVFGANGGAYTGDLLAAVEDSLILGADVINMSLGSPAGFTSDGEEFDAIYGRVSETNTILAVAAGNSDNMGQGNLWGTGTNLTSNPDNSVISSPATYVNATSVASVDNVGVKGHYIETEGQKISYSNGQGNYNAPILDLAGEEYEYAMVGNFGQTLEDFTSANVEGKIAVVQRGITAFTEKHELAEEAGAIACLIYNNTTGTIGLDLSQGVGTIPCASITMKDGEFLAAAKEANADAKIFVAEEKAILPSDTAYQMSDFSSWGIAPNLKIEPDVTAPGGNIYSTTDDGTYGVMSGTSMASPNTAGVAALIMQYAKAQYPEMAAADMHNFVNRLLVSTAEPLTYDGELDWSPRKQGSGLVNAYNSVKSTAYLTVDGMDVPKIELGDDVAKTGSYSYTFDVVNFGTTNLYFDLNTTVQSEGVYYEEYYDANFMSLSPVALPATTTETSESAVYTYDFNGTNTTTTADARALYLAVLAGNATAAEDSFRYDVDGNDAVEVADAQAYLDTLVGNASADLSAKVLKVPAGQTVAVDVTVNVAAEGKEYMDTYFENGIYVEGYTKLAAKNVGGVDLSIPYLAFYGDWTKAPIIDSAYYWQDETDGSQYFNVLFANYIGSTWYPGLNPYIDEAFDTANISLSPNWDGYADYLEDMYVSLLRNARTLNFTWTDAVTGEVYFDEQIENVSKSFFMDSYQQIVPYVYSWYSTPYDMTDAEGNTLADNTVVNLSVKATLDYDAHESSNLYDEWVTPITIDLSAPELHDAVLVHDETTGKYYMDLTISDNVAIAAVNFLNKSGTAVLAQYPVDKVAQGEQVTMRYDITGFGEKLVVVLGDYAFNEGTFKLDAEGNVPFVDETLLYGYRVSDANYADDSLYGWIGINPETAAISVASSEYYMDYALISAAYVGDYIIAIDANDTLVAIKPGYWDERVKIASLETTVNQLAYDASTQTLYGYDKDQEAIVKIDIETGVLTALESQLTGIYAMACTDEGVLYGVDNRGNLRTIDTTTGDWGETVASTGLSPYYAQSMTYDKDTDSLYWAFYSYLNTRGNLYKIDLANNYEVTQIGLIGGYAEVVGLLTLDATGFELPEAELESIAVDKESVTLLTGRTANIVVEKTPWYAETGDFTWTSANEAVATVDATGMITAVAEGTTVITVTTEDGALSAECEVKVVAPVSQLYAFSMAGETTYNQWLSFNASEPGNMTALTEGDFVVFYAGEYVDGYVYAYSSAGEFYKVDAETFEKTKLSGSKFAGYSYMEDMSYDYSTGFMYGLYMDDYGCANLVVIDTLTGDFETLVYDIVNEYGSPMISMAIDADGTIYMLSIEGILYTFDVTSETVTKVGYTGYAGSSMTQCLAFDHNTGELYWSMISNASALMYVDKETGAALPLGSVDGFCQLVAMYAIPENAPARPEVAVESIEATVDKLVIFENATTSIPVSVKPFNATNRTVTWTVANPSVVSVSDGLITGLSKGSTTITGTVGELSVTLEVEVMASTGAITGYILSDMATGASQFWGEFDDFDLSEGNGLAMGDTYMMYAGEYYDGKIYGYGPDYETWDYTFYVIDRETLEVEQTIACGSDAPDVVEMAFDYSTGTMYAIAGVQNAMGNNSLYMVDINNGAFYKVATLGTQMMTLACTEAGVMYGVDVEGNLYQIDKTTGALTLIGFTGYYANQYQSMAYDYDTGNMYWAQAYYDYASWATQTALLVVSFDENGNVNVDTEGNVGIIDLGTIGTMGCMVSALHIVPDEAVAVQTPAVTGLILDKTSELLAVGELSKITAKAAPISVVEREVTVTYTSDNTAVATVAEDGTVTAVGAGKAIITATCGDVSATCEVNVAGENDKLYIANPTGWETSPLLDPATVSEGVTLPAEAGLTMVRTTYNQDGYFYAVDEAGTLWKFTEDMTQITEVGNILEQLDNAEEYPDYLLTIVDLEANEFNGKLYAAVGFIGDWDEDYYIYEIDTTTAAATTARYIGGYICGRPADIAFISENTAAVYDSMEDYVYSVGLEEIWGESQQLAFVQFTVASGEHLSMTYSKEFGQIFLATDDTYNGDGTMALYKLNPVTGIITKVANAAYNTELISIFFVNGVAPVTGVAATAVEEVVEEVVVDKAIIGEVVEMEITGETTETTEIPVEEVVEEVVIEEVVIEEVIETVEETEVVEDAE